MNRPNFRAFLSLRSRRLMVAGVALLLVGACSSGKGGSKSPKSSFAVNTGAIAGAAIKAPDGAYTGSADLTIDLVETPLVTANGTVGGETVLEVLGPVVNFGPDGTQFAKPVTVRVPFSATAYNALAANEKSLAVLVQVGDGSPVEVDIGPIKVSQIKVDVGPMQVAGQMQSSGSPTADAVWIHENSGNADYGVVIEFEVMHFSSYQVVALASCTSDCGEKQCGDDGCGGSCGECGADQECDDTGQCPTCVPNCGEKQCGADDCGGSCGECKQGEGCGETGQCISCETGQVWVENECKTPCSETMPPLLQCAKDSVCQPSAAAPETYTGFCETVCANGEAIEYCVTDGVIMCCDDGSGCFGGYTQECSVEEFCAEKHCQPLQPCNDSESGQCPSASYECNGGQCELKCDLGDSNNVSSVAMLLTENENKDATFCPVDEVHWFKFNKSDSDFMLTLDTPGGKVRVAVFTSAILAADPDKTPVAEGSGPPDPDIGGSFNVSGSGPSGWYYVRVNVEHKGSQSAFSWVYKILATY